MLGEAGEFHVQLFACVRQPFQRRNGDVYDDDQHILLALYARGTDQLESNRRTLHHDSSDSSAGFAGRVSRRKHKEWKDGREQGESRPGGQFGSSVCDGLLARCQRLRRQRHEQSRKRNTTWHGHGDGYRNLGESHSLNFHLSHCPITEGGPWLARWPLFLRVQRTDM